MSKEIDINFSVSGNFRQTIVLHDGVDISPEDLAAGLKDGKYVTSMVYCPGEKSHIYQIFPFAHIGDVVAVDVFDDTEYDGFELNIAES